MGVNGGSLVSLSGSLAATRKKEGVRAKRSLEMDTPHAISGAEKPIQLDSYALKTTTLP